MTKEPGGTDIGADIRKILLSPKNSNLDYKAELFLYLADRAQHYKEVIAPNLDLGRIVICDRFIDSTYVYQGIARKLNKDLIDYCHNYIFKDFLPSLTILLDIDPVEGLKRVNSDFNLGIRNSDESRLDNEKLSFHKKIRQGFLDLVSLDQTGRFAVLDANDSENIIFSKILEVIKEKGIL